MDKRTVIAFILCGILTFVWLARNQQRAKEAQSSRQPAATEQATSPESITPEVQPAPDEGPSISDMSEEAAAPGIEEAPREASAIWNTPIEDNIPFGGPDQKLQAILSNRGACLTEARLTEHLETQDGDAGKLLLKGKDGESECTFALSDPDGRLPLDTCNYTVTRKNDGSVVFTSPRFDGGLRVIKEFTPRPGTYEMGVKVTFKNEGVIPRWYQYNITAAGRLVPEGGSQVLLKGLVGYGHDLGKMNVDSLGAKEKGKFLIFNTGDLPYERTSNDKEPVAWAGVGNRYFATVLLPKIPEGQTANGFVDSASFSLLPNTDVVIGSSGRTTNVNNVVATLTTQREELQPEQEITHEYIYFIGPKKRDVLEGYPGFDQVLDYGFFGVVSRFLLTLLNLFHRIIPNYGVGIILMTLLVKLCLHPLTRKGQIAMHKMQKLQPLIKEIQEKHKNDKQRQSKEQMELFRKHNANPMSGCMPMLLQLPVFLGLFRMLQYSVDLRHEPFVSWIHDLARPDTITHFGTFPVNILPVLMVASWIGQQLTMPKPADPQQAQTQKMMLFMPIVFGFMLYGMPSGLILYWLTSTTVGIIEQRLIRRHIRKMDEKGEFMPAQAQPEPVKATRRTKGKRR